MAARVFKDTYFAMVAHCGGEDDLPETLRLMCRRAAAIEAECINLEARFALARAEGGQPSQNDLDLYSRLVNTLRGLRSPGLAEDGTRRDARSQDLSRFQAS